jgi:hypothetical protein
LLLGTQATPADLIASLFGFPDWPQFVKSHSRPYLLSYFQLIPSMTTVKSRLLSVSQAG